MLSSPRFSTSALALAVAALTIPLVPAWATDTQSVTPAEPEPGDEEEAQPGDIIVTAAGARGTVPTDIPADSVLDADAIASYGASNAADLVAALTVQTRSGRSRGGGRPVILLNGRRISGFGEIRNLPPEAIQRVEVFPEEVAVEYGYAADQRVINFILRDQFSAVTVEVEGGGSTAGGYRAGEGEVSLLRLAGRSRFNLTLNHQRGTAITEDERDIILAPRAIPLSFDGAITARGGGEIDPALSALAGRPVTLAGVPAGGGDLADFAALADQVASTDERSYRSLAPATQQSSIDLTIARPLHDQIGASLNLRYDRTRSTELLGLAPVSLTVNPANPASPFADPVVLTRLASGDALRGVTSADTFHAGASTDGRLGRWRWSVTGNFDSVTTRTSIARGPDVAALQAATDAGGNPFAEGFGMGLATLNPNRTRAVNQSMDANAVLSGALFELPAGNVRLTAQTGFESRDFSARSQRAGLITLTDLGRTVLNGSANIDVPIADRGRAVLDAIGSLSVNGRLAVRDVSDFGTLTAWTAGLTWSPAERLTFIATWVGEDSAPSVTQLGAPLLTTPAQAVYDFTRGETVLATVLTGGNPALLAEAKRDFSASASWRPLADADLALSLTWSRAHSRNTTADLPLLTPEIEAAFPDRVERDADGRLIQIDRRPVNFAETRTAQLRYGVSYARSFGQQGGPGAGTGGGRGPGGGMRGGGMRGGGPMFGGPGGGGSRWNIALYHTVKFDDEILIRPGVPLLDLLDGSATGSSGGTPRHEIEFEGGRFHRGIGLRMNGSWRAGTTVDGGLASGGVTTSTLHFSPLFTVNLRAFVDFNQQAGLLSALPFLRNARFRVGIDNLFDDVRRVRDATGEVPLRYQSGYLDPQGRTFEIEFRKQF